MKSWYINRFICLKKHWVEQYPINYLFSNSPHHNLVNLLP